MKSTIVVGTVFVISLFSLAFLVINWLSDGNEFAPLEITQPLLPETITVGLPVPINNGICNTTDEPVTASIILNLQSATNSSTAIQLIPQPGNSNTLITIPPNDCISESSQIEALPSLPTGRWLLAGRIMVVGQDTDRQVIDIISNVFEIKR